MKKRTLQVGKELVEAAREIGIDVSRQVVDLFYLFSECFRLKGLTQGKGYLTDGSKIKEPIGFIIFKDYEDHVHEARLLKIINDIPSKNSYEIYMDIQPKMKGNNLRVVVYVQEIIDGKWTPLQNLVLLDTNDKEKPFRPEWFNRIVNFIEKQNDDVKVSDTIRLFRKTLCDHLRQKYSGLVSAYDISAFGKLMSEKEYLAKKEKEEEIARRKAEKERRKILPLTLEGLKELYYKERNKEVRKVFKKIYHKDMPALYLDVEEHEKTFWCSYRLCVVVYSYSLKVTVREAGQLEWSVKMPFKTTSTKTETFIKEVFDKVFDMSEGSCKNQFNNSLEKAIEYSYHKHRPSIRCV